MNLNVNGANPAHCQDSRSSTVCRKKWNQTSRTYGENPKYTLILSGTSGDVSLRPLHRKCPEKWQVAAEHVFVGSGREGCTAAILGSQTAN